MTHNEHSSSRYIVTNRFFWGDLHIEVVDVQCLKCKARGQALIPQMTSHARNSTYAVQKLIDAAHMASCCCRRGLPLGRKIMTEQTKRNFAMK